jgi:hypothetical protein
MQIRPLVPSDIPSIAALHADVLDWSINGRMGVEHLIAMYTLLLSGKDIVGFAADSGDELLAFQVSTCDWRQPRLRLTRLSLWRKLKVALRCLMHPGDLIILYETLFKVVPVFERSGISAEMITWVSRPGNPLASLAAHQCLMASLNELAGKGHEKCLGQFQKPNTRPQAYFEKLGYEILFAFRRNDIFSISCNVAASPQKPSPDIT